MHVRYSNICIGLMKQLFCQCYIKYAHVVFFIIYTISMFGRFKSNKVRVKGNAVLYILLK